jgi:chemotaxis-related protein WspB
MLVLMCDAGGSRFAIAVRDVVEVVARPRLDAMPDAPDWVAGLFNYRGRVTPVIDLGRLTGLAAARPLWSGRIVVVHCPGQPDAPVVGLLVDRAVAEQREELADAAPPSRVSRWGAILLDEQGMFCRLDLGGLLTAERQAVLFPLPA